MLSYAMDLEDSHHYPSSDAAASQYAKLASCCHKPSQSIWEYYKSFKEVKKICMVQRSFNYKKLKNWENFQIALTHAVLTHCFLQAVSSNTKNFKTSSQPIDLTVSIVESKTESSSPIQNLYMIALPLNDCLVVAETLLAQDFLTKLYQSQKPSHSLKNILSHSLACLSSYSAKKVFYFKLEDNKTLFENMIVKFIVDFELYYSGITTEKDVDYFITDYIWRSLRLEFVLEQIILPIQHQGLHYLEKACIPLPEMTCNIDLPILNFQHKYTALLLQSYPLIASFSYFFPMSFIAALRTILPQCQEILAEKDASLIKILAVNFLDKVILDFNSQSIYDKYMYMVDGLKLTCLHDLYGIIWFNFVIILLSLLYSCIEYYLCQADAS